MSSLGDDSSVIKDEEQRHAGAPTTPIRSRRPRARDASASSCRSRSPRRRQQVRSAMLSAAGAGRLPGAWTNEVIGKDAFVQWPCCSPRRNGWCSAPASPTSGSANPTTSAAAAQLAQAYPGRFVWAGSGTPAAGGRPGRDYGRPLATMRDYQAGWVSRPGRRDLMRPSPHHRRERPEDAALAAESRWCEPASRPEHTAMAGRCWARQTLVVGCPWWPTRTRPRQGRRPADGGHLAGQSGIRESHCQPWVPATEVTDVADRLVERSSARHPDAIAATVREQVAAGSHGHDARW